MSLGLITTPTGEAVFTKLDKPDTTYGEPGVFTVTIALTEESAKDFQIALQPALTKAARQLIGEGHSKQELTTPVRKDKTGRTIVTAKVKASGKNKATGETFFNTVKVVDVEGNDTGNIIGKGSKLKLSGELVPYAMNGKLGVTFRLKQVQVVELVKLEPKKASTEVPF